MEGHLRPISELGGYRIEEGDQDPRGWSVVTPQGARVGKVEDLIVDTQAMKVRYLVVELDDSAGVGNSDDRTVLLNTEKVELRDSAREVLATGYGSAGFDSNAGAYAYSRPSANTTGSDGKRLTRSEEELHIGKREVNRGEARIGKHVETEHVREPVTRRREEVVIERRPVEAGARADAATIGHDEVRIPLMEEEVVVEKRPVVKEELIVGKRVVEERDVVETEVRRERFDLESDVDPATRGDSTRGRGND